MIGAGVAAAVAFGYSLPALVLLFCWPKPEPWVGPSRMVALSLEVLLATNASSVIWGPGWTPILWFFIDHLVFLTTFGAGLATLELVARFRRRRWTPVLWGPVVGLGILAWVVGLFGATMLPSGGPGAIFLSGAIWALGLGAVVFRLLLPWIREQPRFLRRFSWVGLWGATLLIVCAVVLEVFGIHVPTSPFFVFWGSTILYGSLWPTLRTNSSTSSENSWVPRMGITGREFEVLLLLMEGKERQAIADLLFISPVTVKNHLASLYRRTETSDVSSLVELARKNGVRPGNQKPSTLD